MRCCVPAWGSVVCAPVRAALRKTGAARERRPLSARAAAPWAAPAWLPVGARSAQGTALLRAPSFFQRCAGSRVWSTNFTFTSVGPASWLLYWFLLFFCRSETGLDGDQNPHPFGTSVDESKAPSFLKPGQLPRRRRRPLSRGARGAARGPLYPATAPSWPTSPEARHALRLAAAAGVFGPQPADGGGNHAGERCGLAGLSAGPGGGPYL